MLQIVRFHYVRIIHRKFSSALYITGDKATNNFVVLTPHIDFNEPIQYRADVMKSIHARKLNIDLDKVEKQWKFFKMIFDRKVALETTRHDIGTTIHKLREEADNNKNEIEKLQLHVKVIKDDLKSLNEFVYDIEENAALGILGLPNVLHPRTPTDYESIIHQISEKCNNNTASHMDIGKSKNLIEYIDSKCCFLTAEAALFEYSMLNYVTNTLLNLHYIQFSNADFARTIVVEGCGINYLNISKTFTLESTGSEINRLHLVGGASLHSFMAYFARNLIPASCLPLKLFSVGRKYAPNHGGTDLFSLSQYSVVCLFIALEDDRQKMDEIFDNITLQISTIYEKLDHHVQFVYVPANELEIGESLRVSIRMYSNYLQKYVEVGNISTYDSYLSKRLLFMYTADMDRKFTTIISGEVLNVQKFLACALENNQQTDLLTNTLQKYL